MNLYQQNLNYDTILNDESITEAYVSRVSLNTRMVSFHLHDFYDERAKILQSKLEELYTKINIFDNTSYWGVLMTRDEILYVFEGDDSFLLRCKSTTVERDYVHKIKIKKLGGK